MHKLRVRQAKQAFKKVKEIDAKKAIVVAQNAPMQKERRASDEEQPTTGEQPRAEGQRPDATSILERVPTGSARDITPLIRPAAGAPTLTTAAAEEQTGRGARPLEVEVAEAPTAAAPGAATPSEAVSPAHVYAAAAETYRSAAPSTVYTPAGQKHARNDPGYRVERPAEQETARPIPVLQAPWDDERSPDTRGTRQTAGERRFTHDARTPYETRQYEPPNETQSGSKKRKRMPWE